MKRRDLILASAGILLPGLGRGAQPCPPPQISVSGGNSATTTCPTAAKPSYSTDFNIAESPVSEGGRWQANGTSWTPVQVSGGVAFGTQNGITSYNDSNACLTGFGPDQEATGTIYKATPSGLHEVEVLLRWNISGVSTTGYECFVAHDAAYLQVVKWNGLYGDFVYLVDLRSGIPVPTSGSTLRAQIIGDVIKVWLNGTLLVTKNVNTDMKGNPIGVLHSGNPGIGFCRKGSANNQFGFTRFEALTL